MISVATGRGRLYQRERIAAGKVWVLDHRGRDGKRKRVVLGTDRRAAEKRAAELLRERDSSIGFASGGDLSLDDLARVYLADLATRAVERHVDQVKDRLAKIFAEVGATHVRDLTAIKMMELRARRLAEGRSHRTVNLDLDVVRALLSWCVRMDLLERNPLSKLRRLPEGEAHQRVRRRALTEAEITRFIEVAREDDARQAAGRVRVGQAAMWRAFIETGGRWSEVTRVTWSDLDAEGSLLHLRAELTKAKRSRVIPLQAGFVAELLSLQPIHAVVRGRPVTPSDRIFLTPHGANWMRVSNNANRTLRRLLDRAGIERFDANGRKLDVHALRHSFASRCARRGVGLVLAQRLLGHSTPTLTASVYSHVETADLREAIAKLA
ncbi:MAG: site-specific integrase [Planctomycetes bacterium]|nr:site-specific integrase [Planctomycetota bacterium]